MPKEVSELPFFGVWCDVTPKRGCPYRYRYDFRATSSQRAEKIALAAFYASGRIKNARVVQVVSLPEHAR